MFKIVQGIMNKAEQAKIAVDFKREYSDKVKFTDPEKEAKKEERKANMKAMLDKAMNKDEKVDDSEAVKKNQEQVKEDMEKEANDKTIKETEKVQEDKKDESRGKEELSDKTVIENEKVQEQAKKESKRYQRGKSKEEVEKLNSEDVDSEIQKRKDEVSKENDSSFDDAVSKLVNYAYGDGLVLQQKVNDNGCIEYENWNEFAQVNNLSNELNHNDWLDGDDISEYENGFEQGKKAAEDIQQKIEDVVDTQQEISREDVGLVKA